MPAHGAPCAPAFLARRSLQRTGTAWIPRTGGYLAAPQSSGAAHISGQRARTAGATAPLGRAAGRTDRAAARVAALACESGTGRSYTSRPSRGMPVAAGVARATGLDFGPRAGRRQAGRRQPMCDTAPSLVEAEAAGAAADMAERDALKG